MVLGTLGEGGNRCATCTLLPVSDDFQHQVERNQKKRPNFAWTPEARKIELDWPIETRNKKKRKIRVKTKKGRAWTFTACRCGWPRGEKERSDTVLEKRANGAREKIKKGKSGWGACGKNRVWEGEAAASAAKAHPPSTKRGELSELGPFSEEMGLSG